MIKFKLMIVLVLAFLIFFNAQSQTYKSSYTIISIDKYQNKTKIPSRVITRRYIPIPFDLKSAKKHFQNTTDIDSLICSGIEIIFENDFDKLNSNKNIEVGSEIYNFLNGCIFVNKKNYNEAIKIFEKGFTDERFEFLGKLFLADCIYDKTTNRKEAIKNAFEYYQEGHDASEDSLRKKLVKYRINYIRYYEK